MDQNYGKKIEQQIERNRALIREARQTIEKMRTLFKSVGADIDADNNIFLKSNKLSPEGRRQAEEIIRNLEKEMADREKGYRAAIGKSAVGQAIQAQHAQSVRLSGEEKPLAAPLSTAINPVGDKSSHSTKRPRIKKVRL